jgi:hypothetical protein
MVYIGKTHLQCFYRELVGDKRIVGDTSVAGEESLHFLLKCFSLASLFCEARQYF